MRRGIFALAMLALAVPGAAAQADPPWARDHGPELHAAYCGPEIKGGPNGGAQPRCAARLVYAGGPPPWAPAHGWRRKHKHHHEPEVRYAVPDLGIELGRCNRDVIGAVLGGAAGGVIGSQIGKGSNRTATTIGGVIAGVLIGGAIGRAMDQADHACVAQTLEQAPAQHAVAWSSPHGARYRVVPLEPYRDRSGRACRDYRTTVSMDGRQQQVLGTACRQPDGSWHRVS